MQVEYTSSGRVLYAPVPATLWPKSCVWQQLPAHGCARGPDVTPAAPACSLPG